MAETTFFANRAVAYIFGDTPTAVGTGDFTNGSPTILCADTSLISVGDYIYALGDGNQYASVVHSIVTDTSITLEYNYEGATATAAIYSAELLPFSVMKGFELKPTFSYNELYGMGSVIREDVARHSGKIELSVKYAKFDPDITATWEQYVINSSGGATLSADDFDVYLNTVLFIATGTDGGVSDIIMSDVYFQDFPVNASENEWIVRDMKGIGKDIWYRSY